jgi:hypothetical protein
MKINTHLKSGECLWTWQNGVVESVEGNGYYASVRGEDGALHFVNYAYTDFLPFGQRLWKGEQVNYMLYPSNWPNPGKISCIRQASE